MRLLAVIEVDREDRVICQAEGCGHSVYKRIHVVETHDHELMVLGSECFRQMFGHMRSASTAPVYSSAAGRLLTPQERAALELNTLALIELFRSEQVELALREQERMHRLEAARRLQAAQSMPIGQWIDQLDGTEFANFKSCQERVRAEMRRSGMDPDLPGYRGLVNVKARNLLVSESKAGI